MLSRRHEAWRGRSSGGRWLRRTGERQKRGARMETRLGSPIDSGRRFGRARTDRPTPRDRSTARPTVSRRGCQANARAETLARPRQRDRPSTAPRTTRTRGTSPFPVPSRATATSGPSQRQTGIVRATRGRRRGQRRADAFTHATIVRPARQQRQTTRRESAATQITAANRPPPPSRPRSPFSSAILARLRHVHCHSARRGLSADASQGQRGPDGRGASPGPKRVRHVFRRGQGFSRPRSPFLFIALTRRAHSSRDFTAGLARRSSGERRGRSTLSARARGWLSS